MAIKEVLLPDIGDFDKVDIIEILVSSGDVIAAEDSLVTLESDKASMEVPAPFAGTVKEIKVALGDQVSQGALLMLVDADGGNEQPAQASPAEVTEEPAALDAASPASPPIDRPVNAPPPVAPLNTSEQIEQVTGKSHASPSVRRFARVLGVDLSRVTGSGPKGRVLKSDVQSYVKTAMLRGAPPEAGSGLTVSEMPEVDFAAFGPIEVKPLSRIQKLSGANLHRNWVTIPHVTQFDEADITGLEEFRRSQKDRLAKDGVKLTLLGFLMKGAAVALKEFPHFNASLDNTGETLIIKNYFNIGIAVDTPNGLVVPVVRDVDQKGLFELAEELGELSAKARDKKLTPSEMQGGTFSISSLGGIGGTAFTPIINAPEVAVLGISRSSLKPVYQNGELVPRLILPLSLSYDHRVIDGADAARFTSMLVSVLSDIRQMLL